MTTLIGLVRDFIAATLGLAIVFGVSLSDEQEAGILLVASTGLALGTFVYKSYRQGELPADE